MVRCSLFTIVLIRDTDYFAGVYVSDLKERSIKDDFFAVMFGRPIPYDCVKVSEVCENVLEIDLVKAWKETDQKASWR
jgi:hypothetical protein